MKPGVFSAEAARDLSEADWDVFNHLTSVELSEGERDMARNPGLCAPEAKEFLAVHWHPEWIPLKLIDERLRKAFPAAENFLAIPTQHNKVLRFGPWAGVEADAYDQACQKVQLLIHFRADRLERAGAFISMMERTYNYRAHQLLDIVNRLAEAEAASSKLRSSLSSLKGAVSEDAARMAQFYAIRLKTLLDKSGILNGSERDELLKNRLLPDFMQRRSAPEEAALLDQALLFIKAVKKTVKAELKPEAFYSPRELIEEARSFGAGVVIPHPPIFWPILLADLDVDGWEIWNPSTPDHALFLAEALARANAGPRRRKLLAFMGDDTHMSSKIREAEKKSAKKQEIGFQESWQNPEIAKALRENSQSLVQTINEYRERLLA